LKGVRLITSDACIGLTESAAEFFPEAAWQRCIVGSLKKLTAICSKPGRVCAFPKRHRNFIFEGDYA
jgi:transposase-like protein